MGPLTKGMPLDIHSNYQTHSSLLFYRVDQSCREQNQHKTTGKSPRNGSQIYGWRHALDTVYSTKLSHRPGTPHITDYIKGEVAKGAVRLMGLGELTLETAPSGKGIIKAHSTISNNFLHTLNINSDSWDITKPKLILDHSYTFTYPTASLTEDYKNRLNSDIIEASTHGICCFTDGSKTEHGTGGGFVISDTRTETIRAFLQNERLLYCLPGRNGSHQAWCRRAFYL